MRHLIIILAILFCTARAYADAATGIIRSVNCGSHSFGLDQPPLIRVYTTGGTRFESAGGKAICQDLKEGDQVEVELRSTGPGTATASRVKVQGGAAPVKDLASNQVKIQLDQSFLLGVNQTAVLQESGKNRLKIRSTEFINTLCKGGYDCGGEGEVGMRMMVSGGGDENEILLTSKNARKPVSPVKAELFGYTIQLIEAGEDVVMLTVRQK